MIENKDWYDFLRDELDSSYFKAILEGIMDFLEHEIFVVYPPKEKIFRLH